MDRRQPGSPPEQNTEAQEDERDEHHNICEGDMILLLMRKVVKGDILRNAAITGEDQKNVENVLKKCTALK